MNKINTIIDGYKDDMVSTLAELVRIPSLKEAPLPGKPFGEHVHNALRYVGTLATSIGFSMTDLDGYMGYIDIGKGPLELGVMAHLDVVPEGHGWSYPPFGATIKDNRMYGRGTADNKGAVIASLFAVRALIESGYTFHKRVRLMLGCDEESGWACMDYYKEHEPFPRLAFSPDGDYPVINAEKGVLHLELKKTFSCASSDPKAIRIEYIRGGERANMVPDRAECVLHVPLNIDISALKNLFSGPDFIWKELPDRKVHIRSQGVSAHGSTPEKGENAIIALLERLAQLPLCCDDVQNTVQYIMRKLGHEVNGLSLGLAMRDDISGSLTLNLGMLELTQEGINMAWDIRHPIEHTNDAVFSLVRQAVSPFDFNLSIQHALPPHYVDERHPLVKTLLETYHEQTGLEAYCVSIGGATYARAMDNAVTFGVQFPGTPSLAHQSNEYVDLDELVLNTKVIAHAIGKLCE